MIKYIHMQSNMDQCKVEFQSLDDLNKLMKILSDVYSLPADKLVF